ncbi:MAG: RluA family pseudouridine synthase [Alphaproteobacteria bacterium]|nr:RluA family pseudouridine synthase [Alphaproteobacteria bacterium]
MTTVSIQDSCIVSVGPEQAGARLDKWLALSLPALSRSRLKTLIEQGRVLIDTAVVTDPACRVRAGQSVQVAVPEAEPAQPQAQTIGLTVVYEDESLIVIDKPAGMVVHPAPGNPDATLVNALLAHCGGGLSGIGGVRRPGIVHRIDKDTSGLIVVAKTDAAHQGLATQFADHSIERAYLAVVWGVPRRSLGVIEGRIGRNATDRKKMAVVTRDGKMALTRYRVLRSFGDSASLVECRLGTGRTHQIRVHMTSIGHPLIGDSTYGGGRGRRPARASTPLHAVLTAFPRQALHAFVIGFIHPGTGESLRFESHLPSDIIDLINFLEAH